MARSTLTNTSTDLVSDSGSVLWSFIQGEQLEQAVTLNFIENALSGFAYEAVVVEANNAANQTEAPKVVRSGGVQSTLTVRVPTYRGDWNSTQAYSYEEVVKVGLKYYRRLSGTAVTNTVSPDLSPQWAETAANVIYIQFPNTLAKTYAVQPGVGYSTYGFFELRVTETNNPVFPRTWKPVRGMVEILFSPTEIVPG